MRIIFFLILIGITTSLADAQTRRRTKPSVKKPVTEAAAPTPSPSPETVVIAPEPKKNERPTAGTNGSSNPTETKQADPTYYYEFSQPEFEVNHIVIKHDETGRGTITFTKKLFDDTVTDPIQLSTSTLERINAAYNALNFLDSTESYQYEKDYSHLGTAEFRLRRAGKQRTTRFNYTVNKDAKILADEYRRIGNQFIWIFDITVARENQPLDAPRLIDALDSLIRRNEISDPPQMLPLLRQLQNDERIPLIARNHSQRLAEKIEKSEKKK